VRVLAKMVFLYPQSTRCVCQATQLQSDGAEAQ
jgi:hypothetical protein